MERAEIVAGLLSLYRRPRYLEVGVYAGDSFVPQRAARKVAVDPAFQFDVEAAKAADPTAVFHQVESDVYFGQIARTDEPFDVIFLDGLHTFEQTLRDFVNATAVLAPGGVIVVDDVLPNSAIAAIPDLGEALRVGNQPGSGWTGDWMGDVYRVLLFIDSFAQGFTFRTVQETGFQSVVWRGARPSVTRRSMQAIATLPYEALASEQAAYNFTPYARIREEVARQVQSRSWRRSFRSLAVSLRR